MRYVGVDPSMTSTGIVVLDDDDDRSVVCSVHMTLTTNKKKDVIKASASYERCPNKRVNKTIYSATRPVLPDALQIAPIYAFRVVMTRVFEKLIDHCVLNADGDGVDDSFAVEIPFGGHGGRAEIVQRAFTLVPIAIGDAGFCENQVVAVNNMTVKKFITGSGNAKKELVIKEVYKRFGFDTDVHDVADAYAIARWCADRHKHDFEGGGDGA